MKMVIAIVQKKDSNHLQSSLIESGFRSTRLASVGGFLSEGNVTFLIGVVDPQIPMVMEIIREHAQSRDQFVSSPAATDLGRSTMPVNVQVGGATVFVLPVEQFEQF